VLALQVELCSPRLIASRAEARRRPPSGFRPGFWPQGQFSQSTPLIRAKPTKPNPAAEAAGRQGERILEAALVSPSTLASAYRATTHFTARDGVARAVLDGLDRRGSTSSRWMRFAMSPACKHLSELSQSV
jgi:hypothetical protein